MNDILIKTLWPVTADGCTVRVTIGTRADSSTEAGLQKLKQPVHYRFTLALPSQMLQIMSSSAGWP